MGQVVSLTAKDGHRLDAYRADPLEPPKGGLVVVQEVFGVKDPAAIHNRSHKAPSPINSAACASTA